MNPSDPLISKTLAPLFINAHAVFMAAPSDSHFTGIGVSARKIEYEMATEIERQIESESQLLDESGDLDSPLINQRQRRT
jgi:hypothetical protein